MSETDYDRLRELAWIIVTTPEPAGDDEGKQAMTDLAQFLGESATEAEVEWATNNSMRRLGMLCGDCGHNPHSGECREITWPFKDELDDLRTSTWRR